MISQTISHYRIISRLGAGGMGEVYLAEDTKLDRKVAIKFLAEKLITDEQASKRLIREAHAAAKLDHPNICSIHEVGQDAGHTFIVMQYVEGETLATRLGRKPLELPESLAVALQVAEALSEALSWDRSSRHQAAEHNADSATPGEGDGLRIGESDSGGKPHRERGGDGELVDRAGDDRRHCALYVTRAGARRNA